MVWTTVSSKSGQQWPIPCSHRCPGAGRPATGKTVEYITLTLPKDLAQKVRSKAKEKNMTLSAYCIESLERFANMNDEE